MDETIYVILKVLFDFELEVWLSTYGSEHKVLLLITYAQMTQINTHVYISSNSRGLKFDLSIHLHP